MVLINALGSRFQVPVPASGSCIVVSLYRFFRISRHLHTRISEHCGFSALTGNPLSCVSKSSISDHSREADHPIEPSDFKIVASANSNHDILIKESLLIAHTKPWLNNNVRSFPLTLF
jgi:hypothetical protein